MTPEIILDLLLIGLLGTTVGYCAVLNRRLTRLRDGHSEFKALVETLTAATDKAQASLKDLRELTESTSKTLSANVTAGRELADELAMITESGNALAERIEARLTGRPVPVDLPAAKKETEPKADGPKAAPAEPRSETEKELLSMLRNVR
jgi:hypothetical protein